MEEREGARGREGEGVSECVLVCRYMNACACVWVLECVCVCMGRLMCVLVCAYMNVCTSSVVSPVFSFANKGNPVCCLLCKHFITEKIQKTNLEVSPSSVMVDAIFFPFIYTYIYILKEVIIILISFNKYSQPIPPL